MSVVVEILLFLLFNLYKDICKIGTILPLSGKWLED